VNRVLSKADGRSDVTKQSVTKGIEQEQHKRTNQRIDENKGAVIVVMDQLA
jgi:hypothetical protein